MKHNINLENLKDCIIHVEFGKYETTLEERKKYLCTCIYQKLLGKEVPQPITYKEVVMNINQSDLDKINISNDIYSDETSDVFYEGIHIGFIGDNETLISFCQNKKWYRKYLWDE